MKASLTSGSETSEKAPIQGVCLTFVKDALKTPGILTQLQLNGLWWADGVFIDFTFVFYNAFEEGLKEAGY